MAELKPCPFCGGEAVIRVVVGKEYICPIHKNSCLTEPKTSKNILIFLSSSSYLLAYFELKTVRTNLDIDVISPGRPRKPVPLLKKDTS